MDYQEIVEILLLSGANPLLTNSCGLLPRHLTSNATLLQLFDIYDTEGQQGVREHVEAREKEEKDRLDREFQQQLAAAMAQNTVDGGLTVPLPSSTLSVSVPTLLSSGSSMNLHVGTTTPVKDSVSSSPPQANQSHFEPHPLAALISSSGVAATTSAPPNPSSINSNAIIAPTSISIINVHSSPFKDSSGQAGGSGSSIHQTPSGSLISSASTSTTSRERDSKESLKDKEKDKEKDKDSLHPGKKLYRSLSVANNSATRANKQFTQTEPNVISSITATPLFTRMAHLTIFGHESLVKKTMSLFQLAQKGSDATFASSQSTSSQSLGGQAIDSFVNDELFFRVSQVPDTIDNQFFARISLAHPGVVIYPYLGPSDGKPQLQYLRSYCEFAKMHYILLDLSKKENQALMLAGRPGVYSHLSFEKTHSPKIRATLLLGTLIGI